MSLHGNPFQANPWIGLAEHFSLEKTKLCFNTTAPEEESSKHTGKQKKRKERSLFNDSLETLMHNIPTAKWDTPEFSSCESHSTCSLFRSPTHTNKHTDVLNQGESELVIQVSAVKT